MQSLPNNSNMNTTDKEDPRANDSLSLNSATGIFMLCFYVIFFVTSTTGNSAILLICNKASKSSRGIRAFESSRGQFFNHYIANLAIADLLFTVLTLGDAFYAFHGSWLAGNALCKIQGCLVETCYSASILSLVAISRERLKSVSGLQLISQLKKSKERKIVSVTVWLLAVLLCSPLFYAYSVETTAQDKIRCHNRTWSHLGRRIYYTITAILLFLFPLVLMAWTYVKINNVFKTQVSPNQNVLISVRTRQRKASRMLGVVTLVFFLLWTPFILIRTLKYFDLYHGFIVWKLSQLAIMASAAVNPFIYSFYSNHFRGFLKRVITCRCGDVFLAESSFMSNSLV